MTFNRLPIIFFFSKKLDVFYIICFLFGPLTRNTKIQKYTNETKPEVMTVDRLSVLSAHARSFRACAVPRGEGTHSGCDSGIYLRVHEPVAIADVCRAKVMRYNRDINTS